LVSDACDGALALFFAGWCREGGGSGQQHSEQPNIDQWPGAWCSLAFALLGGVAQEGKKATMKEEIATKEQVLKTLTIFDLYMAAYAVASGVTLLKVIPQPTGGWVTFEFDDSEGQASRALGEWSGGKAMVRAREYASAIRQVRRLTYN
jgi:hypothetical protein